MTIRSWFRAQEVPRFCGYTRDQRLKEYTMLSLSPLPL